MSGNRLRDLPDTIGDLAALVELEAAGNLLEAVPPSLGRLGALRKLSLNGNVLTALPDTLSGLASLQVRGPCLNASASVCSTLLLS